MKESFFSSMSIAASDARSLPTVNCIKFKSVAGTVKISFREGDYITVTTGDRFQCPFPMMFKRVRIEVSSASSCTVICGIGSMGDDSGSVSSGAVQATTGSPEGVLDASNGQWAFDDADGSLYVNINTSGTTGWVQLIG